MFQDEYKRAYDQIEISKIDIGELEKSLNESQKWKEKFYLIIRPIAVTIVSFCLLCILALPVVAEQLPVVYQVIEKFAPDLVDYILPEEAICTSNGITLQVEAVNIQGNVAEVILSFKDANESEIDQIYGRIDLYESYQIVNYGENMQIGGCNFLEYNSLEDKAYFKVDITSDTVFQKEKIKLMVNQLLTHHEECEQEISLDGMIDKPKEKNVEVSGISGTMEKRSKIPFWVSGFKTKSQVVRVMDIAKSTESMAEALCVTGVAYEEGILRVQQCRGSFENADRHIRFFLKDKEANERIPDASVSWQEKIDGEKILFEESWFVISEQELEKSELFGDFYITEKSVKGEWEIIVNLEEF